MTKLRVYMILIFISVSMSVRSEGSSSVLGNADFETIDNKLYQISVFLENGELDKAKISIDEELKHTPIEQDEYNWLKLTYLLAEYYYYSQNYTEAKDYYMQALPYSLTCNDTIIYLNIKNSIGLICSFENNLSEAFDHYLEALDMLEQIHELDYEYESLKLILLINLITLQYYPEGQNLLHYVAPTAIELAQKLNDSLHLGIIYNTLAIDYRNKDDFANALTKYREAFSIFIDLEEDYYSAHILNNLGALYNHYGLFDSALYYYDSSLVLFEQANYQRGLLTSQLGIATVLSDTYNFDEARELIHEVIEQAREYNFNTILLSAYIELVDLEYYNQNYKKAFDINQKYNALNDSLFTVESADRYNELLSQLELLQKETEIDALKSEKLEAEYMAVKVRKERQLAVMVIVVLIILVYFIILSYRQKLNANTVLTDKNKLIERKNKKLEEMNKHMNSMNSELQLSQHELMLSNNSKNRFFSILAHDLRNPLHNATGLSFLFSKHYEKLSDEERANYTNDIYSACNQLNRLLENLLEWSRTQTNEITFMPEEYNVANSIESVVKYLEPLARQKSILVENQVRGEFILEADRYMLEAVFRNLINNAIKYTHKGGKIEINAKIESGYFYASITDNGIGISKENLRKIFSLDSEVRSPGTENEKGTGLGLVICKEFVKKHNGTICAESELGEGAVFHLKLPLVLCK